MTVVFDSGIWVSALEFGGVPSTALIHALTADEVVYCTQIESEVVRILQEKFGRAPEGTRRRLEVLLRDAVEVEVGGTLSGICRDPKDDFILECATEGGADVIISGDKDLTSLGAYNEIGILTPKQFLDRAVKMLDREHREDSIY